MGLLHVPPGLGSKEGTLGLASPSVPVRRLQGQKVGTFCRDTEQLALYVHGFCASGQSLPPRVLGGKLWGALGTAPDSLWVLSKWSCSCLGSGCPWGLPVPSCRSLPGGLRAAGSVALSPHLACRMDIGWVSGGLGART